MIKITDSPDVNKWSEFVINHPNGNIFQTPEMAEVYRHTKNYEPLILANIDENGDILAFLQTVVIAEKNGILKSLSSRSIIQGGPLYIDNLKGQNAVVNLMKEYDKIAQKKSIYSQIRNMWDVSSAIGMFNDLQYKSENHLNFLIDLNKTDRELWDQIKKSRRYSITKAEKNFVVVEEMTDESKIPIVYELLHETYRNVKMPLADISLFESAFKILTSKNMLKIFLAKYNEQYIGTIILLLYKDMAYDWYAGANKQYLNVYPNDILAWYAIKWSAKNSFHIFDFGGAGKPNEPYGPRDFKKQFGGNLESFPRLMKIYSPTKFKIAEKGFKIYRGLFYS